MFGRLFDERYRSVAAGVHGYAPVRLVLCLILICYLGVGLDWLTGAIWGAAALVAEAGLLLTTRRIMRIEQASPAQAWGCLAVYAVAVPIWSVSGILLWSSGDPACLVAAAGFFGGHLLYIQAYHAHSPGAALPVLPAMLAPALTPMLIPQFHGAGQVIVCLTLSAVVLNSILSMWISLRKSLDLQAAHAATLAASQAKSEFLARMSHEIRTPLNGVLGMAQAMHGASDLSPDHRQSLAVIRQSGESLLTILNDILDLSKVEAGRLEVERIPFDLEATVRGAQEAFAPQARAKGLGFRLDFAADAAGLYLGDPTRMRQILYNLLSNAVKFTAAGEVSLSVARGADALELVVTDSGIGISVEERGRLFSRFHQADSATARRYGGTGLGLSICRELAELMGGSIEVQSDPGAGSRFIVVLPLPYLGPVPADTGLRADTLGAGMAEGGPPLRILAAEDNPVNQLVLRTLLAQVGLEPTLVGDGAQALEAWRAGGYDLILMDVQMPVMDGLAACTAIRAAEAAEPGRTRTPILALTANAMSHQVAEYLACGFDGHVAKPIDAGRLYEAIAQAADAGDDSDAVAAA